MNKLHLIIDDLYREYCLMPDSWLLDSSELIEYETDITISKIYSEYPEMYGKVFACLHDRLNKLLSFMKDKYNYNKHYNAQQSRDLRKTIESIKELQSNFLKNGMEVKIDQSYSEWIDYCMSFLAKSDGCEIPDGIKMPTVIKYEPIFVMNNLNDLERQNSTKVVFDSEYQNNQAKELIAMIEKDQINAISLAKNYVEACLQTILTGRSNLDLDKLDMTQLLAEAKKVFKLNNSKNAEVVKIIKGLSTTLFGILELRNRKGSDHAHTSKITPPSKIEARLAVDSAITLVNFFWGLGQKKG